MLNNYETSKSAFMYSSYASKEVKKICKPLENLGIKLFRYLKVFEDCSYLTLMNGYNNFLTNYYDSVKDLGNLFVKYIRCAQNNSEPFYLIWPNDSFTTDINMNLFYEHNIWNGISLIYRYKGYVEIISFAYDRDSAYDANLMFLNHMDLLKEFVKHFKVRAKALIENADINSCAVYKNKFNIGKKSYSLKNKVEQLRKDINVGKQIFTTEGGEIQLTKRETECLELWAYGKTTKAIARSMNLSPRTVESHLMSVKGKTECNYKSELIDLFFQNQSDFSF